MDAFQQTFGPIIAICLGIIFLALFFTGLGALRRTLGGKRIVKLAGFIKDGVLIDVHLAGGKMLERVKLVGVSGGGDNLKGIPFGLTGMVVFEKADGRRILIKSDQVKMIEECA